MCCGHGHGRYACPQRPHGLSALRRGFILQFPRRLRGNRPAVRRRASRLDNRRGAASARMERALPDRNVEELTERDLAWADLVMTGGMIVQQRDTLDIIRMCRARAIPVAVGGPD